MAKVTAPLLSFGASGQIGSSLVFGTWKGVKYGRQYVIPKTGQATNQLKSRAMFSYASAIWRFLDSDAQDPWNAYVSGKPLTNRNAFISAQIKAYNKGTNNDAMIGSPGYGGAPAPESTTVELDTNKVKVTLVPSAVPDSWTTYQTYGWVVPEQDIDDTHPYSDDSVIPLVGSSDTYIAETAGTVAVGTWVATAWIKYTLAGGKFAWTPALTDTVTRAS